MKNADPILLDRCRAAYAELVQDWETIVNIDSPTCHGEGLEKVGRFVADALRGLGADVATHPVANASDGFNVVGSFTGRGKGKILLLVHMDTVFPVGSVAKRPFRIDAENKASGPGVSDDKSGVVLCLHALKILRASGFDDFATITLFANCQEENGSVSSRELIKQLAREHDCVLCAEAGVPGDAVCISRPGSGNLFTEVAGVAAHAAHPWLGCNAADELARQVIRLNTLADTEKRTVVTTRILESGTANRDKSLVPDHAEAVMRVFGYSMEEIQRVEASAAAFAKEISIPGTTVTSAFHMAFPPLRETESAVRLVALAQEIYRELGLELKTASASAAADSGWASLVNDATICCMGPVGNGQNHSEKELADAASVVPRLYLLVTLLQRLGAEGFK